MANFLTLIVIYSFSQNENKDSKSSLQIAFYSPRNCIIYFQEEIDKDNNWMSSVI